MIIFHIRSKFKWPLILIDNISLMKNAFVNKHKEIKFALIKLIFFKETKEFTCCKHDISKFEIKDWLTAFFDKGLFRNKLMKELLQIIVCFNL